MYIHAICKLYLLGGGNHDSGGGNHNCDGWGNTIMMAEEIITIMAAVKYNSNVILTSL